MRHQKNQRKSPRGMMIPSITALFAVLFILGKAASSMGGVVSVSVLDSTETIQNALATPCTAGDPLTVAIKGSPGAYTHTLTHSLNLSNNSCPDITIEGVGTQSPVIDADTGGRALEIIDSGIGGTFRVTLKNLTITRGKTDSFGGGIFIRPGGIAVTLEKSAVTHNHSGASGGGLAMSVGTSLLIKNSVFSDNTAVFNGGGIFNFGGSIHIDDSSSPGMPTVFIDNSATLPLDPDIDLDGNDIFTRIGITVSNAGPFSVSETGTSQAFGVKLTSAPASPVSLIALSSDETEGVVEPSRLDFNPANWNTYQTLTITGQDDHIDDNDQDFTVIIVHAFSSGMPSGDFFNELIKIPAVNADDDTAGITVTPLQGLTTTEAGGKATFTVRLNSEPTAEVMIDVTSDDATEGLATPVSLVFSASSWAQPVTVTVTGIADDLCDGDMPYSVTLEPSPDSGDPLYRDQQPIKVRLVNNHAFVDGDKDDVDDCADNCPSIFNPDQEDADGDLLGNPCDACPFDPKNDEDRDGICGDVDNCPGDADPTQSDFDEDGIGDVCDPCPGRYFVDGGKTSSGTGLGWDNAFMTIQEGIDASGFSCGTTELWMKKGLYLLSSPIQGQGHAAVYGGFAGDETDLAQRDRLANRTIIDGNGAVPCLVNNKAELTLDGLVIQNGFAPAGGGIQNRGKGRITVANTIMTGNAAVSWGGAIFNGEGIDPKITLVNSSFYENHAFETGGALYNADGGKAVVVTSSFIANTADFGGGAIHNDSGSEMGLRIASSIFAGNRALVLGGAILNESLAGSASPFAVEIYNSTFFNNSAMEAGQTLYNWIPANISIMNSILWNTMRPDDELGGDLATIAVSFSDISQECFVNPVCGFPVKGNMKVDPRFAQASGMDPLGWDLHLRFDSPLINMGSNLLVTPEFAFDIDGQNRILHGTVDIGADEVGCLADKDGDGDVDGMDVAITTTDKFDETALKYLAAELGSADCRRR